MNISIKYFGMVAEMANTNEEVLEVDKHLTTEDISLILEKKLQKLGQLDYRLALNQNLINESVELNENDTIAVLPPFAGG